MNSRGVQDSVQYSQPYFWLYFILFFVPLVGFIHRLAINILIDPISTEFGLTDTSASFLQGPPFALVYGLMVIPMGLLADRVHRVRLLGCGALIWSIGTLLCGLAPDFSTLFAARMLVGLGEAALIPVAITLIGDLFPDNRRGLAVGIFFTGVNAGFSSAYAVCGLALDLAEAGTFTAIPLIAGLEPWRQVFFLLSIPGFVLPLLLLTITEPRRMLGSQSFSMKASFKQLLENRVLAVILLLLIVQATAMAIADNGIYAWLPRLLTRMYALSATEVGLVLGIIVAAAGTLGGPIAGKVTDHLVTRRGLHGPLFVITFAVCIATVAVASFAIPSIGFVYVATALWVTCIVAASSTTFAFVSIAMPNRLRGFSSSLITAVMTLVGLGAGPTTIAVVLEALPVVNERVDMAIVVAGLPLCCLALVVLALIWRRSRELPAFAKQ